LLYSQIPGLGEIVQRHGQLRDFGFLHHGIDPATTRWDKIKGMFEVEYTIFAD